MLSNPYAQAGLHPYSSLYAQANQDVEKGKLLPTELPNQY